MYPQPSFPDIQGIFGSKTCWKIMKLSEPLSVKIVVKIFQFIKQK
jgi:hypothetical protein